MTTGREGRSEMERGNQRTLTMDDTTSASRPGQLKVSLWRWSCRYPKWPGILVGGLGLTLVSIFWLSPMFVVALPLVLISMYWYVNRVREQFLYGDANPGMVVSVSPLLIAVWTDMRKEEGRFPVLSVREEKSFRGWGVPTVLGQRVATVGLYGDGPEEHPLRWEVFEPLPVEPIAAHTQEVQELFDRFPEQQWQTLERTVRELKPAKAGLFFL